MEKLLVSACLLGCPCRYDGKTKENADVIALKENYELIPVCPEQLGGLPTPRLPSERVEDKVLMRDGTDVTGQYRKGAKAVLRLAKLFGAKKAVLKARSPSCGKDVVYDGTFSGALKAGSGVTALLLRENGIAVFTEEETALL